MEPILLQPYFREKIWGGNKLHTDFHFDIPSEHTGEAWVISAHPSCESTVTSPAAVAGQPLSKIYNNHPDWFGQPDSKEFPLLIKILDATDDLSVQVHPDDEYARIHENDLGKTECWYILSAEPGAKIVYGHHAKSKEAFKNFVENGQWSDLLCEIPVNAGDFYYVPHGTIHAIGAGITILETQQSSDTTYRVYDYDRVDDQGNQRDLHIDASIDVSMIPHQDPDLDISTEKSGESVVTHFLTNDYFSVYKWDINGQLVKNLDAPYTLATVIDGSGQLIIEDKHYDLTKGDAFILPNGINQVTIQGNLSLITSNPETKA